MIARFYSLVLREPDGSGRKRKAAELIASGVPYKKIKGRRWYQLVSTPHDVYNVPEGWTVADLVAWAPSRYDAFFFNGGFTALVPLSGRHARTRSNETVRCLREYNEGNGEPWIVPVP